MDKTYRYPFCEGFVQNKGYYSQISDLYDNPQNGFYNNCCALLTVTYMWLGGPDTIGSVRPAGKWANCLTCQTAKTPACNIQIVTCWVLFYFPFS
jgi:hypothetical protein